VTSSSSVEGFDWIVPEHVPINLPQINDIPNVLMQLFYRRGIKTEEEIYCYLSPKLSHLHDPFLIPDMCIAVNRIIKARDQGELISIFGDFDSDGISATVLLYEELIRIGCKALSYIPNRSEEGHGLNRAAVEFLESQGVSLIITVDTGISAIDEVLYAKYRNIDTIITDHHVPKQNTPEAFAILSCDSFSENTNEFLYPFQYLTGAGLAFKLVQALDETLSISILSKSLEMAALGTIADMAPLIGENRVIAIEGLKALKSTERPGYNALFSKLKIDKESVDYSTIPFVISPRINSPGRMKSPDLSFSFLTEKDQEKAEFIAIEIENINRQRMQLTQSSVNLAIEEAAIQSQTEPLLVLYDEKYHIGLIGLIAGRVAQKYNRPAFVITKQDELLRGSGRSIPEFDIVSALEQCSSLFIKHGGHKAAGGFTANPENFEEIKKTLQIVARKHLNIEDIRKSIIIDSEVMLKDLVGEAFSLISSMEPFGIGNPVPVFISKKVQIIDSRLLGIRKNYASLKVVQQNIIWDGFCSSKLLENFSFQPSKNKPIIADLVYSVEKALHQGISVLRLRIIDFKLYASKDI
jgi:single-stranded-DNA-specific exonuclease